MKQGSVVQRRGAERQPPEGWEPYLDPGERLLWTGVPGKGIRLDLPTLGRSAGGIFFLGFAIFWTGGAAGASKGGALGGLFALFGLPFIAYGAWLAFGHIVWDAFVRSGTRYAVTDRRAFIATQALGRRLESYPIDANTELDYRPGPPVSIYFAKRLAKRNRGGTHEIAIGFPYLKDGDAAYRALRLAQRGGA